MTALECWQQQRAELKRDLEGQKEISGIIYAARHAILQTEQNTLASQSDDILRQQMGVLFALLKNNLSLLNVNVTQTAWAHVSRKKERKLSKGFPLLLAAGLIMLGTGLILYYQKNLPGCLLVLAATIAGIAGLVLNSLGTRKQTDRLQENLHTTCQVDAEQLIGAIEAQIVMIDRCAQDFAYLNQSLRAPTGGGGWQNLEAVSELLETIYSYDDDLRQQAEESMRQLLVEMGLEAVDYSLESEKLFTQLPSKNMTRTLCPALLSAEDHRLLRRGTAVVSNKAA